MAYAYAVRHKPTGFTLPTPNGRRGGSWVEPTNEEPPRLFKNHHAAACYMRAWLKGQHEVVVERHHDIFSTPDDVETLVIHPVEGRNADDMEVVKYHLEEVTQWA